MRWAPALLLGCVGLAACNFHVTSLDGGSIVGADLSVAGPPDLSPGVGADLSSASGCGSCPDHCDTSVLPPVCQHLVPTGPVVRADFVTAGLTAQNVASDIVIDTDTGAISGGMSRPAGAGVVGGVGFRVASQGNGPSVGVFSVAGLTVAKAATIRFSGSNAFALASAGSVTIAGTFSGSANLASPGPGGGVGGSAMSGSGGGLGGGAPGGSSMVTAASGGGGGGFGDSGGQGAAGSMLTVTAGGGITGDLTMADFTLIGGSGGGLGGGNTGKPGGLGGGGGGALQLSVDGEVVLNGIITVGGGGGRSGGGGGGGGAGGAIKIEAAHIKLSTGSVLAANGGGGGAGAGAMMSDGANGNASVTPAAGGNNVGPGSSAGGVGGASNGKPGLHFTVGGNAPVVMGPGQAVGGGGGGGCGRIALRALLNGIDDQSTAVTPDLTDTNSAGGHPTSYDLSTFQ